MKKYNNPNSRKKHKGKPKAGVRAEKKQKHYDPCAGGSKKKGVNRGRG